MRWLFLLLLVLNAFYYVWHLQEAPLRAKDVTPLNLYKGAQHDIRLLSEAPESEREVSGSVAVSGGCLYLGGFSRQDIAQSAERRLTGMDVRFQPASKVAVLGGGYWVQIAPESRRWLGDVQLQNLSKEFNELKHKIMLCEGVAPVQ